MATLSVWKFPTATGAQDAEATLLELAKEELIQLHDGAIVTWPEGRKKPKTWQLNDLTGTGALSGGFWGLLFGILFFVPFLGFAIGAAFGAMAGHFADVGIDDTFIDDVRAKVTPGTSALFVLTSDAVSDKVAERFKGSQAELISTNLSNEDEAKLRAAFADD